MSLQFVMGPSGAGKSHYLYQMVTDESLKNADKNYIVLVPDQFTMQTQKDLVMTSPKKGILNVDVLSFNRLAYRVFEETGGNNRIVLNDVGKNFVLRKVASNCEKNLRILGSNLKKTGFISEVKSVISEFTQYDITMEMLEDILQEQEDATGFYYKMKDIGTLYEGFQEYLRGKYITGEELLDVLCEAVPKSKLLKNSVVVLDGFTGFTPVQNKLLRELLLICEKVIVTVTIGTDKKAVPLFDMSKKMMESLVEIAGECKVEIEEPVRLFQRPVYRFLKNEPLDFLESHLFRYARACYEKKTDAIQIYSAQNPKEEMEFVAQSIRRLVRKEGLRYREIAVIASDMSVYVNHAEKAFEDYEIPVFMDHKRSILLNSFVEYLRSLLAMAEQNFTYESVFRYLRTDLTGFTKEEIDCLENYCVALGIRGYKKWQEKWIRRTKNMEESELAAINEIRQRFMQNIEAVMAVLKSRSKTVESVTKALHEYLLENELQKKVKAYETQFGEKGELALEKEYTQVYRIVMELFDQFVELLGDEKISLKEYCELLDAGLEEAKVGIIPPSLDQVVVGDIERTRIKDVKVIFFVGANDAYIPGKMNDGGLLSERDREKFEIYGTALAPGAKEKAFVQKFYLYLIFTKPSNQLVLSYSRASSEGTALHPAYVIQDLMKMYSELKVHKIDRTVWAQEFTEKSGIQHLIEGLRRKKEGLGKEWQELYTWYKKNPEWCRQIERTMEAAFYQMPDGGLTEETARKLYGTLLSNSVSRLEKFSACAYAHFLEYGLRLQQREVYQFLAVDLGNLFHGAMERFSKKLEASGDTWVSVSEGKRETLIEESVEEAVIDYGNTILYSSARNEYTITRLKRLMKRTVWALTKQLEKGDFVPEGYEMVYDSGMISLGKDRAMRVYGKIDRIDTYETENEVYVKVIDYKTGTKAFDLGEFYHGLQMQLVVYMNAAIEMEQGKHKGKNILPAGLFYYQMKDPMLEKAVGEEEREELLLKELKPDGVVNSMEEVLVHMDRELQGASTVIPAARNKDGSLSKGSKVLAEQDFQALSEYVEKKMAETGNEILDGEAKISPYAMGEWTACDYCPYKGICGFDEKLSGYQYRKLKKFDGKEEVLNEIRKEAAQWESDSQKNNNK